ncbi:MAG: TorF family putative porin [Gammaproteobacteria bacterium]
MFKTFKKLTAAVVLLTSASISQAETEISYSANIGFMSDYMYRGIHQSSSSAMGGLDLEYGGFYLGTWWADLQEDGWVTGSHRGFEYDVYAGYGFDITDAISASIGYTIYRYTDKGANAFDDDYDEVNVGLSIAASDSLSFAIDYAIGENTATDQSETDYDVLTVAVDYMGIYALFGTWGVSEDDASKSEVDADWMEFGYSRSVGDFDLSAGFVLSEKELATGSDTAEDGDFSRFIFSMSTSF